MLRLSVMIAVAGLLVDSAALVIRAMLIAPLMTLVLAFAFAVALAMGWPRHLDRAGLTVVLASAGSVADAAASPATSQDRGDGTTPERP